MRINNFTYFTQPEMNKNPEFKGYKSSFSKTLDEVIINGTASNKQKNKMTDFITKFINKKLKADRVLGRGFHGAVYKIDDKYVLKIDKGQTFYFENSFLGLNENKFSDIKSYYGEPVTRFGNGIRILKNVSSSSKHIPVGVPANISYKMTRDEMVEYYKKVYLPTFSALPQKSFDGVAKAFDLLNKKGKNKSNYRFDVFNPNNFVLVGKQIRIVDDISKTSDVNPNNLPGLLKIFLTDSLLGYDKSAVPHRRELFKKVVLASEKYELPHGCDFEQYCYCFSRTLCDIEEIPLRFLNKLTELRNENKNIKIRLQKINDYLNTL